MAKKKGKKKSKKGDKKGKKKSSAPKVVLSKEEQIEKCIAEHLDIIHMMWNFIVGPLSEEQIFRETLQKKKCAAENMKYVPKTCVHFDRFKNVLETMTNITEKQNATNKPNMAQFIMLDIFEWFDANVRGLISYQEFEQRMGEFFREENASKPKKKTNAKAKKTKKKSGKSKKKKK